MKSLQNFIIKVQCKHELIFVFTTTYEFFPVDWSVCEEKKTMPFFCWLYQSGHVYMYTCIQYMHMYNTYLSVIWWTLQIKRDHEGNQPNLWLDTETPDELVTKQWDDQLNFTFKNLRQAQFVVYINFLLKLN